MPYFDPKKNLNSVNKIYTKRGKGETIKDAEILNAVRQFKKLDPKFMGSVKAQTRKLSPQQKGAALRQLEKRGRELERATRGKEIFIPGKKKGESGLAYTRRVNKLKRANGQQLKGNLLLIQNQEIGDGKRHKIQFSKDGRIISKYKGKEGETKSEFIGASHIAEGFPVTPESLRGDLLKAVEVGESWGIRPPDVLALSMFGVRMTGEDFNVPWGRNIATDPGGAPNYVVGDYKIEGKNITYFAGEAERDGRLDAIIEAFFSDNYEKPDPEDEDEEDEDDPAEKIKGSSSVKNRMDSYDGIYLDRGAR